MPKKCIISGGASGQHIRLLPGTFEIERARHKTVVLKRRRSSIIYILSESVWIQGSKQATRM